MIGGFASQSQFATRFALLVHTRTYAAKPSRSSAKWHLGVQRNDFSSDDMMACRGATLSTWMRISYCAIIIILLEETLEETKIKALSGSRAVVIDSYVM